MKLLSKSKVEMLQKRRPRKLPSHMDPIRLDRKITALLSDAMGSLRAAERILLHTKGVAESKSNEELLEYVLQELTHLYVTSGETAKAARAYELREKQFPKPYVKLDRAFFYFQCLHDYRKALVKLREVTTTEVRRNDFSTFYSALNLSGRVHLRLKQKKNAIGVLKRLIGILQDNLQRPVFGFETAFVEEMQAEDLAVKLCREYRRLIKNAL